MARGLYKPLDSDIAQRTSWYVFVRFLFLIIIGLPSSVVFVVLEGWDSGIRRDLTLLFIALGSNVIFYLLSRLRRTERYQKTLAGIWLALDLLLVTGMIFINGGIESRSPILYVVPILMAAAIFGRRATYLTTIIASVLYCAVIVEDYAGPIHTIGAYDHDVHLNLPYVVNSIFFFPMILLVIALAVDFITRLVIQKERQASENLEALERAQDIARLGSWEWDVGKDEIVWSDGLIRIYGFADRPEHFSYETYLGMIHPDDVRQHQKTVGTALKKKIAFKVDHRVVMSDGSIKYVHGEGRPLLDQKQRVVKFTGTAQDVTEGYLLDNAKREFVSLASHQLRTPASGVKAFLSLLLDGYAGPLAPKQREFALRAQDANNRQLDIIDSLLSLAAIEAGKLHLHRRPMDIVSLVKRCATDYRPDIKSHKQKLVTSYPRRRLRINGDASHLQMAIDNLISNAIKYTPDKGRISVIVEATDRDVYIKIADTGIGIAVKDKPELFQKFRRLHDPASQTVNGSGLGLYLARYIVKLHKGTIRVSSQHGKGAEFVIKLPLMTNTR